MYDLLNHRSEFVRILRDIHHIPGGSAIDESLMVTIGGVDQHLQIRGKSRDNPVLLFIHGGPGSPETPTSWLYQRPWEEYFVVVQWDQRGCGKSFPPNLSDFDANLVSVDRMIADGVELVDYLRQRFDREKLFVVGHSWGTVIGLALAQCRPESLHAYVGIGQVIHSLENEAVSYDFATRRAADTGNTTAMAELASIAPYPPSAQDFSVSNVLVERKWINYFGGMVYGRQGASYLDDAKALAFSYTNDELVRSQYSYPTIAHLLPQILSFDATGVTHIACPVFIFAGRHDYATPSVIASKWFAHLTAPHKQLVWFEQSAHMMHYEEPGKVLLTLLNDVLPLAHTPA